MLNQLAKLFEVSLDQLVNGEDDNEVKRVEVSSSESMNCWEFASQKWWLIIIILLIIGGTLSQIFS
ncbi:hypothetical protein [Staphylococcus sp. MI 10-1553]